MNGSGAVRRGLTRSEALEVLVGFGAIFYAVCRLASIDVAIGVGGVLLVVFGLFGRRVFRWA